MIDKSMEESKARWSAAVEHVGAVGLLLSAIALVIAGIVYLRGVGIDDGMPSAGWRDPAELAVNPPRFFSVETLTGDTITFPQEGSTGVIVAYRSTCNGCIRSLSAWERLGSQHPCLSYVLFVSVEPLDVQREYWQRADWGPQYCHNVTVGRVLEPARFRADYRILVAPVHYLISADFRILRVWAGPLDSKSRHNAFFAGLDLVK